MPAQPAPQMPRARYAFGVLVIWGTAGSAQAGNGLNPIGFGLESNAMAGADLAVARDVFALNTNPAGLAQLRGRGVELHATAARLYTEHDDGFGPSATLDNEHAFVGDLGATTRLRAYPVTLGANVAVTGGAGFDYGRITTLFGNQDQLASRFGVARASVGGGIELTDRLAVGGSFGLSYAVLDQKVFPNTSSADPVFVGTAIDDASAHGTGFTLGARYRPIERLTLGLAYASKVDLPIRDGTLRANLGAFGLGTVRYRDLKLDGLAQPSQLGVGLAYQVSPAWLLAADLSRIDWSEALKDSTLRASDPDDPRAPPVLRTTSRSGWRDQWVLAVGTAYRPSQVVTLWAGYNHGRNPIPNDHLSPLLATIARHHVTAGAGYRVAEGARLGLAMEYQVPNAVDYDNAELPFGPDLRARTGYVALHVGLSLDW